MSCSTLLHQYCYRVIAAVTITAKVPGTLLTGAPRRCCVLFCVHAAPWLRRVTRLLLVTCMVIISLAYSHFPFLLYHTIHYLIKSIKVCTFGVYHAEVTFWHLSEKKVRVTRRKIRYISLWGHLETIVSNGGVLGVGFVPVTLTP